LNVSKKEQKKRFLDRLSDEHKNWKFSTDDIREREHWDEYQSAYEKMISNTATKHAPWIIAPADNKWFTRLLVVATVVDALNSLDLKYPNLTAPQLGALKEARKQLENE
jgi:polyphosphate kinase 2 (PPK2 family)